MKISAIKEECEMSCAKNRGAELFLVAMSCHLLNKPKNINWKMILTNKI